MSEVSVVDTGLFVKNMKTRIPFEYGITRLTALPHLFVCVQLEREGRREWGVSADGLAPKWFTKQADQTFRQEVRQMCSVISSASDRARNMEAAPNVFTFWWRLYQRQMEWGRNEGHPDLLTNFGISLVERAMIDAFCRLMEVSFHGAIQQNLFQVEPGRIHDELAGSEWLSETPQESLRIRHTVGLGDPITEADVDSTEGPDDGLPHTLEENIKQYGVNCFKIKVPHEPEYARHRLGRIADVLNEHVESYTFTLDANEAFEDLFEFREHWEFLKEDDELRSFVQNGLLFVEQPVKREKANSDRGADPTNWPERPPLIIDESDSSVESLPEALKRGYHGTSHKNCKGVFKGIVNCCLIGRKNHQETGEPFIMSAEDLSNVGPVALLQDLAVVSVLGIDHAERNGHHYFAGLRMMPKDIQQSMLETHGRLYRDHSEGEGSFPSLRIEQGKIRLDDVNQAPFGYQIDLDPGRFTPLSDWTFDMLELDESEGANVSQAGN